MACRCYRGSGVLAMTTQTEAFRSLIQTRKFLFALVVPGNTPGVPKAIREQASALLKHYPYAESASELKYALRLHESGGVKA